MVNRQRTTAIVRWICSRSFFFFPFFSALITSCSSTGSSAPHSVTFYAILYRICARAKSRYILPPSTPTNDNSLIHPLSISHFYDEPNRIPSHRLSFNVLPFMVIQLIHILVGSLCFSRRPRSMVRPHCWRLMPLRCGITSLAEDKKQ